MIELQAHHGTPVQPWAARTGDGVTVAIPQLQGGEQGAGNRNALGASPSMEQECGLAANPAHTPRERRARPVRLGIAGQPPFGLPPRGRIIRETDSHDPGDRFASTWRHSHEPGTHKMAVILAIESHDPGTVTIVVAFSRSCDSPNFCLAEAEFVPGSCDPVWPRAVVRRGRGRALRPRPRAEHVALGCSALIA